MIAVVGYSVAWVWLAYYVVRGCYKEEDRPDYEYCDEK